MKPTSLNLIAISIFVITMSALLGPLVNLSPVVPASLTFFLLGLATLDGFAFQSQGVTIFVDWLGGTSSQTRDRILHHEAGHFLVACLMEIPISGYALNAWEAFRQGQTAQGGVRFNDQQLWLQLQQGQISAQLLDRYCTVWMAGVAAEDFKYDQALGGQEDRDKIRAIWTQLRRPATEATLKERWATLQAKTLIENNQSAYEALVNAMAERTPVEECYRIIKNHLKT